MGKKRTTKNKRENIKTKISNDIISITRHSILNNSPIMLNFVDEQNNKTIFSSLSNGYCFNQDIEYLTPKLGNYKIVNLSVPNINNVIVKLKKAKL
jgi:hypothetical protein